MHGRPSPYKLAPTSGEDATEMQVDPPAPASPMDTAHYVDSPIIPSPLADGPTDEPLRFGDPVVAPSLVITRDMRFDVGVGDIRTPDYGIGCISTLEHGRNQLQLRMRVTLEDAALLEGVQLLLAAGHVKERLGEYADAVPFFREAWDCTREIASDALDVCILTGWITSKRNAGGYPPFSIETCVRMLGHVAGRTRVTAPAASLYAHVALGSYFSATHDHARARIHYACGDDLVKDTDNSLEGTCCLLLKLVHGQSWMRQCADLWTAYDLVRMDHVCKEEVIPRLTCVLEMCGGVDSGDASLQKTRGRAHRLLAEAYERFCSPRRTDLVEKHRQMLYEESGRTFPDTCAICLDNMKICLDGRVTVFECLHAVHQRCADEHAQARRANGLHAECPVCRARVNVIP